VGANKICDDRHGFRSNKASKLKRENGFKSETVTEFERLINSLYLVLPTLTHHQFKQLKKIVHKQFLKKFAKNQPPKYGSLNKGFTEQEVQMFLRTIDNPKLRLKLSFKELEPSSGKEWNLSPWG